MSVLWKNCWGNGLVVVVHLGNETLNCLLVFEWTFVRTIGSAFTIYYYYSYSYSEGSLVPIHHNCL